MGRVMHLEDLKSPINRLIDMEEGVRAVERGSSEGHI